MFQQCFCSVCIMNNKPHDVGINQVFFGIYSLVQACGGTLRGVHAASLTLQMKWSHVRPPSPELDRLYTNTSDLCECTAAQRPSAAE